MTEWLEAIESMKNGPAAKDYVERNRHDSFAPVRPNSYVNWFVLLNCYSLSITCCSVMSDAESTAMFQLCEKAKMLTPE